LQAGGKETGASLSVFWNRKKPTYEEARAYVIQTIRDFLNGGGGAWDWDDFISCPAGFPELEEVRGFCLGLPADYPPAARTEWCSPEGLCALKRKLEQLEGECLSK